MKVAILDDLNCFEHEGGAQLNMRGMVRDGIRRGHDIEIFTPQNINTKSLIGTELIIISNVMSFPRSTLKEICAKYPYVFHHKDMNFCNHRIYYPQIEKCKSCINREFWLPLYQGAKMHIWLSPLHREGFLYSYPELASFKKVVIPSCLEVNRWKPIEGVERKPNTVIAVNSLAIFKGRYVVNKYVEQHPELHFTFVGNDAPLNLPNCTYLPYVKNEELPALYSAHEYFLHLPPSTEAFGRTGAEALLTGCKIITNENNGAFSYDFMRSQDVNLIRRTLSEAALSYWEELEVLMGVREEIR